MNWDLVMQALISGLLNGGVYALIAIGLTVIYGVMNIINFAHGSLLMISMYVSFWLYALLGVDPYVSLVVNIPFLFFIGYVIQKFLVDKILNAPHHIQILLMLGLLLFVDNLALFLWSPDYRTVKTSYFSGVFPISNLVVHIPRLIAFIFAILISGIIYLFLKKTDLGKAIRASAQQKEGALLVGINVKRIYAIAFGIGAACVGAAGSLITPFFYVAPDVGFVFVILAFIIVVFGGMGSFIGAIVGGLIIGVIESLGAVFMPGSLKHVIVFGFFIIFLLFKPSGIFGAKGQ